MIKKIDDKKMVNHLKTKVITTWIQKFLKLKK